MLWNQILVEIGASLKFHRRRVILTAVSLAWGLACFVILMSYGNGFGRALNDSFTRSARTWCSPGAARPVCRPAA
jgi:hypothetical protein